MNDVEALELTNPDRLPAQLIRALRSHRTQGQMSRWVAKTNVVSAWEHGHKSPRASTFLKLLSRLNLLDRVALRFFTTMPAEHTPASWLTQLHGGGTVTEVAERMGVSRHAIGRWLRGAAEPRLPDLLRFVHVTTGRLMDFVSTMVDPAAVPCLRQRWARHRRTVDVLVRRPVAQLVMLALETVRYRQLPAHDAQWLAHRLSLESDQVEEAMQHLMEAGLIELRGGFWVPRPLPPIDTRWEADGVRELKDFWLTEVRTRFRREADGLFSHNLITISEDDLPRLRDLQVEYFGRLRSLVSQSEPAERVVLVQWNVVPLDEGSGTVRPPSSGEG